MNDSEIGDLSEYVIDGNVPFMEFEKFYSSSNVCQILSYALYIDIES